MKQTLPFVAFSALVLAGCQSSPTPEAPVVKNETTHTQGPVVNPPEDTQPGPVKETPSTTPDSGTKKPTPAEPKPAKPTIDFQVAKQGSKGWGKTAMTLSSLGGKLAAAMSGLKNTRVGTMTLMRTDEGEGQYEGDTRIKDSRAFKVDYVIAESTPKTATDTSDGTRRVVRIGEKFSKPMPAGQPLPVVNRSGADLAAFWNQDFGRMAFQGLTDGKDTWKPVFGEWAKGTSGLKPVVEERQMLYKNQMVLNYRVRAERSPQAAKKYGPCVVEIVVDGKHFVPVTIRVERTDLKGKKWLAQWSAHWQFGQTIGPDSFKMPVSKS